MGELTALILAFVLACSIAFSFGHAFGSASEKDRIVDHCDRVGTVIVNRNKMYECRLKEGGK